MRGGLFAALALAGCVEAPPAESTDSCVGTARGSLTTVDRKIVGQAVVYPADGTLRARDAELRGSMAARREIAWQTVAKVFAPVVLAEPLPGVPTPNELPLWQTWHDSQDVRRVFHRLYGQLSDQEKRERARFSEASLSEGFAWNVGAVDELPNWPAERYLAYVEAIDNEAKRGGVAGISRVSYSPGAAKHLLRSYPDTLNCRDTGTPQARAPGPRVEQPVATLSVQAAPCQFVDAGSYALFSDETLRARVNDPSATMHMQLGDRTCVAELGAWCELAGPGEVSVRVSAGETALASQISVHRRSAEPEWAACLDGPFPLDAALVKADYRRADFGLTMPSYDTSAPSLASQLTGNVEWQSAAAVDPGPAEISTLTLPNGASYRLAGLHLMTKELDHWLWITLWWSNDPDADFGADRPSEVSKLGRLGNYKMCVVTAFDEQDPAPGASFGSDFPSLAAALAATYSGVGTPSWCSNPYLELGPKNAGSNCIGCHQHGGTELLSEEILLFSEQGRPALRNNFPHDYSWALVAGDDLGQLFADEESYYLGAQP